MALNYQPGGLRAIIVIQALLTIWRHFRSAQSKWRLTGFRRAFRLLALSGLQHEELHVELVDLPAPAEFGDPLSPWRRVRDLPVAQATDCWHAEYRASSGRSTLGTARSACTRGRQRPRFRLGATPSRTRATRPERTHEKQTDPPRVVLTANPADPLPPISHIRPGCPRPAGKALLWSARFRPPA